MADRTSASIFGMVFTHLAENPTPENIAFAKKMAQEARSYDFNFYQMYCDDALTKLGLTKRDKDEDGFDALLYEGEDY